PPTSRVVCFLTCHIRWEVRGSIRVPVQSRRTSSGSDPLSGQYSQAHPAVNLRRTVGARRYVHWILLESWSPALRARPEVGNYKGPTLGPSPPHDGSPPLHEGLQLLPRGRRPLLLRRSLLHRMQRR